MAPWSLPVEPRDSPLVEDSLTPKRTKAIPKGMAFVFGIIAGDHLISHTVARAVPSAQRGLTSVFGMGTGDPSQYGHRQIEALCGRLSPQPRS
jgi:hypothetical protein